MRGPRPGPPPVHPVTVELMGGPGDGASLPFTRPGTEPMPHDLPGHPGYQLLALDTRFWPPRWRYGWATPRTGRRNPCTAACCTDKASPSTGCPNRRRTP